MKANEEQMEKEDDVAKMKPDVRSTLPTELKSVVDTITQIKKIPDKKSLPALLLLGREEQSSILELTLVLEKIIHYLQNVMAR